MDEINKRLRELAGTNKIVAILSRPSIRGPLNEYRGLLFFNPKWDRFTIIGRNNIDSTFSGRSASALIEKIVEVPLSKPDKVIFRKNPLGHYDRALRPMRD